MRTLGQFFISVIFVSSLLLVGSLQPATAENPKGPTGPTPRFQSEPEVLVTRKPPKLNRGRVDGSIRILSGESFQVNGTATVTGDLYVPGNPEIQTASNASYKTVLPGKGNPEPSSYTIRLNGNSVVGTIITHTDPITMPAVPSVSEGQGIRDVFLLKGQDPGNFQTIRNLTLTRWYNLMLEVPEGTYGNLVAHGKSGFIFGRENQETTYNLQSLELNSRTTVHIRGKVTLNLKNGILLNSKAKMGDSQNPSNLSVNMKNGGARLNSQSEFYGNLTAPSGTVILNSNSQIVGFVVCDQAILNSNSQLKRIGQ